MAAEVGFAIYEGHLGAVLKVFVYYTICEKEIHQMNFILKKSQKSLVDLHWFAWSSWRWHSYEYSLIRNATLEYSRIGSKNDVVSFLYSLSYHLNITAYLKFKKQKNIEPILRLASSENVYSYEVRFAVFFTICS